MAEQNKIDLSFVKKVNSIDTTSYPDVSLQPDIQAANQIQEVKQPMDLSFVKKAQGFKIFGVPQSELEKGGEKMKDIIGSVVQDVKNLYGDVGVPEAAKVPSSKEEKEFFGFNTDIETTDLPYFTDKTGLKILDIPKIKAESKSTLDFTTKIGKHIAKTFIGDLYALGDIALKTTFLPIQVPISIAGATLEEMGKDLGQEKLQDIEEKLFGSRTIKPNEIKEGFEEVSHILLADVMSKAPKMSDKQIFKDVAKKEKIDPKIIIEENVKPKADDIIEKTVDAFAEEISKTQNKSKDKVKTEILNTINTRQADALSKIDKEIIKTKQFKETKKNFELPKEIKEQQGIPNYVENAIQMAANFNYKAIWNPGPKYKNMNLGVEVAGKDAPAKLIRRDEILTEFVKDLNIGIGVTKSRKALGQFFPGYETLKLKYKNDIDTAAHEIGHFFDKRIDKISDKYNSDPIVNRELKDISYDVDVVQEGFAEFMKTYLGDPKAAKEVAPNFFDWFDATLREDGFSIKIKGKETSLRKSVLNAQSNFAKYFSQDPLKRIDSKIGYTKSVNQNRMGWKENILSDALDSLLGIEKMEKDLGSIDTPVYKRASSFRQGESILKLAVEEGIPIAYKNKDGFYDIKVDPSLSLHKIFEKVSDDLDNFVRYIVSKSAFELRAQNRERLFNDVEIAAGLKLESPKFEKAFKEYQQWNKGILKFAIEFGEIITQKQVDSWNRIWYLPFWRANQGVPGVRSKTKPTAFRGIKALTGGSENLRPILENILGNAQMLISESVRNRSKLEILDSAIKNRAEGSGRFINPIREKKSLSRDLAITRDIKNQLYDNLFGTFDDIKTIPNYKEFKDFLDWAFDDLGPLTKVITVGKPPRGYEKLIPISKNGKIQHYEVTDPLLFRAIQGLEKPSPMFDGMLQLFSAPKKIAQASITLSADFIGANAVRDTITSSVMSQSGYIPILSAIDGIKSRVMKDPAYIEWMANGGDLAGYYINEGLFKRKLKKFYDKKGINLEKIATSPIKLIELMQELASVTEVASRLGEYKQARRKGESISEAVYRSKNISVDFSKRGSYETWVGKLVQFYSELVPFFRAALLGTERLYRGVAKDPNRLKIARRVGYLAGASGALALANSFNPLYDQLEDWDKDTHWHIFVPTKKLFDFVNQNERLPFNSVEEVSGYNYQTGETDPYFSHWRIPKIWEIGSVASLAERALIGLVSGFNKDTIPEMTDTVLRNFMLDWKPAFVKPVIEWWANKNSFTNRPIQVLGEEKLEPGLKGEGRVSKTSAAIGEKFNINPLMIEHYLRGYLNTFANYGFIASDQFFFNDAEDLSLNQMPFIRRFRRDIPNRNNKYISEAYGMVEEITKMVSTIRESNKRLNPEGAYDWLQAYAKDENMSVEQFGAFLQTQYQAKNKINQQLIEYNRELQLLDNAKDANTLMQMAQGIENKYGKIGYVKNIIQKGLSTDIGALKKFLKDDIYIMRNNAAKDFVDFIENLKEGE